MSDHAQPWSIAWERAALGRSGFYRRTDGLAEEHFRTDVMDGDRVARRIVQMALRRLVRLCNSGEATTITDAGSADGRLLVQLMGLLPRDLVERLRWRAIDVRERPPGLDARIEWLREDIRAITTAVEPGPGLLIAHELLDDIPCDVVEMDDDGLPRLVLVDPADGMQQLGPALADREACAALGVDAHGLEEWCAAWWPVRRPVTRTEVGLSRDRAWRDARGTITDGLAIAIDYAHVRPDRVRGRWDGGTLVGYRQGRIVSPVPDGTCNLTAHVALDACASGADPAGTRLYPSAANDDLWWLVQDMAR